MKNTITFDKSLKKEILTIFDKKINSENVIVEKENSTQKVLSPDGNTINIEEFAGVGNGSEIFLKSDLISLIEFTKRKPKE